MEGNGPPRKATGNSSSVEKELYKDSDPDAKTTKGASKAFSSRKRRGKRERLSGKGTSVDDLVRGGGGVTHKRVSERKVSSGKKDFGGRDVFLDDDDDDGEGLDDSETSVATSLWKMHGSGSLKGLSSVIHNSDKNAKGGFESGNNSAKQRRGFGRNSGVDALDSKKPNPDVEIVVQSKDMFGEAGLGDDEHKFNVGHFVWGKVNGHRWWPGRIYDSLDASDFAKKVKTKDRIILVAFFGDQSFGWCTLSQLKPFDENFAELSRLSSSKMFINAVEKALEELGRLVESEMTCSCVPKEDLVGFGKSFAANAGIKEGLLVPKRGIDKFSTASFEPAEFLAAMNCVARVATMSNMLELTILKSWLLAFYRTKGGYKLPTYHEPQPVPGLEDDNRSWAVDLRGYNVGMEVNIGGPVEDLLSSPRASNFDQTTDSSLRKCQEVPEGRRNRRRKQKSIAEILGGNPYVEAESKEEDAVDEETNSNNVASFAKRKKMKDSGGIFRGNMDKEDKNKVGDMDEGGAISVKSASLSRGKKRKGHHEVDDEGKKTVAGMVDARIDLSKPVSLAKGKKRKGSDESNFDGSNELTPKSRKDAKLSESLRTSENNITSLEVDGSGINKESRKRHLRRKKKCSAIDIDKDDKNEMEENTLPEETKTDGILSIQSDDGEDQMAKDYLLRERKKSKYLSSPYTKSDTRQRMREMGGESHKVCTETEVGEPMTKAADSIIGSPPFFKCSDEKIQEKASEEPGVGNEKADDSDPWAPKQDQKNIIDPMKVKAPPNEILQCIRSTALSPMSLNKSNSLDVSKDFFSAFRSSIYYNISNYGNRWGRKSKSRESKSGLLLKQPNKTDHGSSELESLQTKSRKRQKSKSDKHKLKQAASATTLDKPSAGSDASQLTYIKQKLEKMASMMEISDGKMFPGMKSKLEVRMKGLLKKVSSMVESSS